MVAVVWIETVIRSQWRTLLWRAVETLLATALKVKGAWRRVFREPEMPPLKQIPLRGWRGHLGQQAAEIPSGIHLAKRFDLERGGL